MGNSLSTQDIARQALARARGLQIEIRGPPCRGAIVDYCEGRLDARRLFQRCTPLEANEFARLAPVIYLSWVLDNAPNIRCDPGQCQFPRDGTHFHGCEFENPPPPGVLLPEAYFVPACLQSGVPELIDMARAIRGGSSSRHAHGPHAHAGQNGHRNYYGHSDHEDYSGHQGHLHHQSHSGHQNHSANPRHLGPRRRRDH